MPTIFFGGMILTFSIATDPSIVTLFTEQKKPLALKNGRRLADKNLWSHSHSHNGKTQGMIDITLMSKTNAN